MSRLFRTAVLIGVIAGAVQAQAPVINSILSSASETLPGLPNSAIAQGSIFVIYGQSMGPASLVQYQGALPLPTTLSGVSVSFTGGGVTASAPLFYVYSGQIAGILPSNIPAGQASVTVSANGGNGSFPMTVVASNFSSYTINGSGTGPAVVYDGNNNTLVTVTNSAAPGDELVLYGTGLGPIIGGTDAGVPTQGNLPTTIQVYVGGVLASLAYHGRSGDAGLDQINFFVPPGVSGCSVPVIAVSGTGSTALSSNTATIAVAANRGAACSDSTGLPLSLITSTNGTISLGVVSLSTTTTTTPAILGLPASTTISAGGSAEFFQYSVQQLTSGSGFSTPSLGGCVVNLINLAKVSTSIPTFTGLNAGNPISVTGPANLTLNAVSGVTGVYTSQTLSSALPQGTYNVSVPGGSNVGAFTTMITLPQAFVWTNSSIQNVTRANGQQITWTGGAANTYVEITGYSYTSLQGVEAFFTCLAPVAPGNFTIPSWVLLSLPPSGSIVAGVPSGTLSVGNYANPVQILPTPSGLNYAYTTSSSSTSILVNFQ